MGIAAISFVIGMIWIPETFHIDIHAGESAAYTAEHGAGSALVQAEPDEI